jgi:hypothetical protein
VRWREAVFALVRELARGLEPLTCCLQDSCATDCATPAFDGYLASSEMF